MSARPGLAPSLTETVDREIEKQRRAKRACPACGGTPPEYAPMAAIVHRPWCKPPDKASRAAERDEPIIQVIALVTLALVCGMIGAAVAVWAVL